MGVSLRGVHLMGHMSNKHTSQQAHISQACILEAGTVCPRPISRPIVAPDTSRFVPTRHQDSSLQPPRSDRCVRIPHWHISAPTSFVCHNVSLLPITPDWLLPHRDTSLETRPQLTSGVHPARCPLINKRPGLVSYLDTPAF